VREVMPKLAPSAVAFRGKFVTRTENILGFDGIAALRRQRGKAQSWHNSPVQTAVNTVRVQAINSRSFVVGAEGAQ
jgi:hypothetical protein